MNPINPGSDPSATPTPPNPPLFNAPFQDPLKSSPIVTSAEPTPAATDKPAKNKLFMMVAIAAGVELLIIMLLLAVVVNQPSSKHSKASSKSSNSRSEEPKPATSVGIQQANDSISNDISGLNDESDFPTGKYDDKNLGL